MHLLKTARRDVETRATTAARPAALAVISGAPCPATCASACTTRLWRDSGGTSSCGTPSPSRGAPGATTSPTPARPSPRTSRRGCRAAPPPRRRYRAARRAAVAAPRTGRRRQSPPHRPPRRPKANRAKSTLDGGPGSRDPRRRAPRRRAAPSATAAAKVKNKRSCPPLQTRSSSS